MAMRPRPDPGSSCTDYTQFYYSGISSIPLASAVVPEVLMAPITSPSSCVGRARIGHEGEDGTADTRVY